MMNLAACQTHTWQSSSHMVNDSVKRFISSSSPLLVTRKTCLMQQETTICMYVMYECTYEVT